MQTFHIRHQNQAGTESVFRLQPLETKEVQFAGASSNYPVHIGSLLPIGDFKPEHFVKRERLLQGYTGKAWNRDCVGHSSFTQFDKSSAMRESIACRIRTDRGLKVNPSLHIQDTNEPFGAVAARFFIEDVSGVIPLDLLRIARRLVILRRSLQRDVFIVTTALKQDRGGRRTPDVFIGVNSRLNAVPAPSEAAPRRAALAIRGRSNGLPRESSRPPRSRSFRGRCRCRSARRGDPVRPRQSTSAL
jgi:hypothetical protein